MSLFVPTSKSPDNITSQPCQDLISALRPDLYSSRVTVLAKAPDVVLLHATRTHVPCPPFTLSLTPGAVWCVEYVVDKPEGGNCSWCVVCASLPFVLPSGFALGFDKQATSASNEGVLGASSSENRCFSCPLFLQKGVRQTQDPSLCCAEIYP